MEKFDAGASLVQLYTGFIYEGPALIGRIESALTGSDGPKIQARGA
jgi:dihydroorotate dehydrogenase